MFTDRFAAFNSGAAASACDTPNVHEASFPVDHTCPPYWNTFALVTEPISTFNVVAVRPVVPPPPPAVHGPTVFRALPVRTLFRFTCTTTS
jgi:hypothetical protein